MIAPISDFPQPTTERWKWGVLLTCAFVVLLGCSVIYSWYAHISASAVATMQYNTALCFIVAGLSLAAWLRDSHRQLTIIGGALVALVGALTVGEYLVHSNFGIDQLLFHPADRDLSTTTVMHPGRMSAVSALDFLAFGAALLALVAGTSRWRFTIAATLASLIIVSGFLAMVGYACGLPVTYSWGFMNKVALHTAGALMVLGTGLFVTVWQVSSQNDERTPRWLPVSLGVGTTAASLILFFALDAKQDAQIVHAIRVDADSAGSQISMRMDGRMKSLVRMAARWEADDGRVDEAVWRTDAEHYIRDFPDIEAIEWIDASHRLRWIAPLAGNEDKLGTDLLVEERRAAAVAQAEREHQPVITRTVTLFHGGLGYVIYVPVAMHGQPDGVLAAVFRAKPLFERYLPTTVANGLAIRVTDGSLAVFERDTAVPPRRENLAIVQRVELRGVTWSLHVWPTPALLAEIDDPLPEIVLAAGLLGAILLGTVCHLAQRASRLARVASRARDAFQRALEEVKTLKGLLPICACCKRVRDDTGYWNQVDTYIRRHTDAKLSHGYCPECAAKAFTEFGLEVPEEVRAQLAAKNFE